MNFCSGVTLEGNTDEYDFGWAGQDMKRWMPKRKAALITEIIQGKTTVAEASHSFGMQPSENEEWVDEAKWGMENALRTKPLENKEQY